LIPRISYEPGDVILDLPPFPVQSIAKKFTDVLKFDPNQPRDEEGQWTKTTGRSFTSEEGYQWHEQGPGAAWAKAMPYEDQRALDSYAGFGYREINELRRGQEPTRRGQVDPERLEIVTRQANQIDDLIANRGLILDEDVVVERGAYLPGISVEDLQDMEGGEHVEKGFTSTFLGEAGGRAKSYPALGKWESIYQRHGGKIAEHQDEVGTAVRFYITLPKGTKVASVEAARRIEHEFPRIQDPAVFEHPDWLEVGTHGEKLKPEDFTIPDFTQKPTVRTRDLENKDQRSESEILIGSGARFRVTKVRKGYTYQTTDPTLKSVEVYEVHMEYIGGGSSEGSKH